MGVAPQKRCLRYRFIDLLTFNEFQPDDIFRSRAFDLTALSDTLYAARSRKNEKVIRFFSFDPAQQARQKMSYHATQDSLQLNWEVLFRQRIDSPTGLDFYPHALTLKSGKGERLVIHSQDVIHTQDPDEPEKKVAYTDFSQGERIGNVQGTYDVTFSLNKTHLKVSDNNRGATVSTDLPSGIFAAIVQRLNQGYYITTARSAGAEGEAFEGIFLDESGKKKFIRLPEGTYPYNGNRLLSSWGLTVITSETDNPNNIKLHFVPFHSDEARDAHRKAMTIKHTALLLKKDPGHQARVLLQKLRTLGLLQESQSLGDLENTKLRWLEKYDPLAFHLLLEVTPPLSTALWSTFLQAIDTQTAEKLWAERMLSFSHDPHVEENVLRSFQRILHSSNLASSSNPTNTSATHKSAGGPSCDCTCRLGRPGPFPDIQQ